MTYWGITYDCCACCDPDDESHVDYGDDYHEEPCEVCDDA